MAILCWWFGQFDDFLFPRTDNIEPFTVNSKRKQLSCEYITEPKVDQPHQSLNRFFFLLFLTTSSVTQPCLILAWSLLEVLKIIPRGSAGIWDYMSLTLPNTICKFLSRSESPLFAYADNLWCFQTSVLVKSRRYIYENIHLIYRNNFLRLIIARELISCKIMFCI